MSNSLADTPAHPSNHGRRPSHRSLLALTLLLICFQLLLALISQYATHLIYSEDFVSKILCQASNDGYLFILVNLLALANVIIVPIRQILSPQTTTASYLLFTTLALLPIAGQLAYPLLVPHLSARE